MVLQQIGRLYCSCIIESSLSSREALASYIQYFLPEMRYQLPLLSLTRKECDKLMAPVFMALLSKLHVNRNTSRPIIHGPEELGIKLAQFECDTRN